MQVLFLFVDVNYLFRLIKVHKCRLFVTVYLALKSKKSVFLQKNNPEPEFGKIINKYKLIIKQDMSLNKDCRRLLALFILVLSFSNLFAAIQTDTVRDNSFINRVSIHTNALDWFLTVPNLGIEYDFMNSEENRFSVLLQGKYNWNTSHSFKPRYVLNLASVSMEFRKYWRTGHDETMTINKWVTRDTTISRVRWFFKKFRHNVLSGRTLTRPRDWRAYYVGLYAGYDQYSLACFGKGIQGKGINLGVSAGWSVPLYILRNGQSLDLDLGVTLGAKATQYDRYHYISETGCYEYTGSREFHVTPYPVIHQIKIGLAYRFRSIASKVRGQDARYYKWYLKQDELRAQRRLEQDSVLQIRIKEKQKRDSVKNEKVKAKELKQKEREEQKKLKASKKQEEKVKESKNTDQTSDKKKETKADKQKSESKLKSESKKKSRKERRKEAKEKENSTKQTEKVSEQKEDKTHPDGKDDKDKGGSTLSKSE